MVLPFCRQFNLKIHYFRVPNQLQKREIIVRLIKQLERYFILFIVI